MVTESQDCQSQNNDWQQLRKWLLLSFLPGLGAVRFKALLNEFHSPDGIFSASYTELKVGLPESLAGLISGNPETPKVLERITRTQAWLESSKAHHIITLHDADYPPLLKELPDPPPLLYVLGDPQLLKEPQLAIVGCRRPTPAGMRLAEDFGRELSRNGLVVTSGMAMGIDTAAHQGVLSSYGATVAVLGTGIDVVYPRSNSDLYASIALQGALVSEFPLGTSASPGNFPRRNRIISGLSLGVLVVEAAIKSGSLISARLAAEQGREVFAVPGSVMNPLSKGCHKLLKEGAVLVESAEDILVELESYLKPVLLEEMVAQPEVSDLHRTVLASMSYEPASIDLLCQVSGLPFDELSVLLTELELDGLVQSVPGGFIKTRL